MTPRTDNPPTVAIVGAGDIARSAHLPAWKHAGGQVAWLVDTDAERARAVARDWDVLRWATELREALDDDTVDIVDICVPATLHAQQAIASLEAGKDVLVEKPVTITLDDLAEVEAVRERCGRTVMVAENWPYATVVRAVEDALVEGEIGEPIQLQASHESDLRLRRPAGSGQGDRDHLGYFFTAGIHTINLARHLVGELARVQAFAVDPEPGPYYPLDDDLVLAAAFDGGAVGAFNFTGRSQHLGPRRLLFRLIGTDGVTEFDVWSGWYEVTRHGRRRRVEFGQPSVGYDEEVQHFLACLREQREPLTSARRQLGTLAATVAAYRSLEEGAPVRPADLLASLGRASASGRPLP